MGCCSDSKLTLKQWLVLAMIGSVHLFCSICDSLQGPFFPAEAEKKNVPSTQYGFVFGIYAMVSFIASPILGNYIHVLGAKRLLYSGVLTAGTSCIFFGLLVYVEGPTLFVTLSILIRGLEALGASAAITSAFAITAATFPDNMATTFATLEIFYGLGFIIGPILGGSLYSLGGYKMPFITVGTALIIDAAVIYSVLSKTPCRPTEKRKGNLWDIIKVPGVLLDSFSIAGVSLCVGFYAATLEPHMRNFKLSEVGVGLVFMASGATYALTSPIVGRLCDSSVQPRHMILCGGVTIFFSVLLVGPAPFLPFEATLPLVVAAMICLGLSMSTVLVSAFTDAIRSAVASGFADNIGTYALVAGLWAASFSLGDFLGPSLGGILVDQVQFRWASMVLIALNIIIFASMGLITLRQACTQPKKPLKVYVEEQRLGGKECEPLKGVSSGSPQIVIVGSEDSSHKPG